MIAVDTNILVYAHRRDAVWHHAAAACLRRLAEHRSRWLVPWPCLHEFLAIVTHPRIYQPPSSVEAALKQVEHWMSSPALVLAGESTDYWGRFAALARGRKPAGPLFHDLRIVAICVEHGVSELWSADRDFSRFPDIRTVNPLTLDQRE